MADYAAQVERLGAAPWANQETLRPWQTGTAEAPPPEPAGPAGGD